MQKTWYGFNRVAPQIFKTSSAEKDAKLTLFIYCLDLQYYIASKFASLVATTCSCAKHALQAYSTEWYCNFNTRCNLLCNSCLPPVTTKQKGFAAFRSINLGLLAHAKAVFKPSKRCSFLPTNNSVGQGDYPFNVGCGAGTNFVVRAQAIMEVGGSPMYTMTEDYALGMELKKFGWHCRYVQEYLAIGEAPHEVRNMYQQRSRWTKVSLALSVCGIGGYGVEAGV